MMFLLWEFITHMGWIAMMALLVGLGCVIFEMFHPGFGAPGIAGAVLLVVSVIMSVRSFLEAVIMTFIILVLLTIAFILVVKSAQKGHLSRKLILNDAQGEKYKGLDNSSAIKLIGKSGIAVTFLRPSGTAKFEGKMLDVVSNGEFIPKDTEIKIVKVEGVRIVVEKV